MRILSGREVRPEAVAVAIVCAVAIAGMFLFHAATYKPRYPGLNAPKPAAERAGFAQMMRQRPAGAPNGLPADE